MGSWPGRIKDLNPNTRKRTGDIRPSRTVEQDLHSAARSSYRSPPVIPDPLALGPGSGIKPLLEVPHKRLSQPALEDQESPAEGKTGLAGSNSGSCKDTDVDVLPSLTNPTEPSEDPQGQAHPDKPQASDHPSEHEFQGRIVARTASERLIEQLEDVAAKRVHVHEMRIELRHRRDEEGRCRAALMKRLNLLLAQDCRPDMRSLDREADQLQSATDAYLDLEQSYHQAEDALERDEYLLIQSIEKFSEMLHALPSDIPEVSPQDQHPVSISVSVSEDDPHSEPVEYPPAVKEYLWRINDAQILEERITNLDLQWNEVMKKERRRLSPNTPMDDESIAFLQSYDASRQLLRKKLNETMLDIVRLRTICEEQGLPIDPSPDGIDSLYRIGIDDAASPFEDPLKASALNEPSPFFEPGSTKLSSTMFINRWILHRLRHSSMEISRLKSAPELRRLADEGWNGASISRLAMTVWFADDTARSSLRSFSDAGDYDYGGYTGVSWGRVFDDDGPDSITKSTSESGISPKKEKGGLSYQRTLSL